jgi:hypothetical protein
MPRAKNKKFEDFEFYLHSELYRALIQNAGMRKEEIKRILGARNNRDLGISFMFPKKVFTIETIEQFAFCLRNVEGWTGDDILEHIRTFKPINKLNISKVQEMIARYVYKRKSVHKPKFTSEFIRDQVFHAPDLKRVEEAFDNIPKNSKKFVTSKG